MTKHYKHVREDEFKRLRTLRDAGLKTAQIADYSGRSFVTVQRVLKADSFEDYFLPAEVKTEVATVEDPEIEALRQIAIALRAVNDKLNAISQRLGII